MAKLTTAQRKKIPKSQFGLPAKKNGKNKAGKGGYPMPDASHARNAKARAAQQVKKGNLSKSQQRTIDNKANRVIKRAGGKPTTKGKK